MSQFNRWSISSMLLGALVGVLTISSAVRAQQPSPEQVKAITKKVADWQIKTFDDSAKFRALSKWDKKKGEVKDRYHDLTWHMGALYAGMDHWRSVADDPATYADWLRTIGQRNGWKLHRRMYHADDHVVGQFYLSMYEDFNEPAMLAGTKEKFDYILAHPRTGTLEWTAKPTDAHHRWGWCDALFMAPPVWARLAKITGEQKYLEFMDQEYHATYDLLWDQEEKLFWRDSSFFSRREKNGEKVFWARGNGWVFGGLALMIPDLPEDWEGRKFYVNLFKEMAVVLKDCQREDGTWSMGLLGGVEGYPIKETSGTSFFTFGMAWGINNGILDRATYQPVVLRAWDALTQCVTDEGLLGHVQPVGAAPGDSFPDKTEVYGIGAFLAAGTEVYKLVGGEIDPAKQHGRSNPPAATRPDGASQSGRDDVEENSKTQPATVFMEDSGWCWFQDPRAIIHDDKLFIGAVRGNGSGPALVGVYDLQENKPLGTVVMQDHFQRDDHNSPVFHVRPDGSVLATYAKHNHDRFHYSRISDPSNPLKWSEEFKHERDSSNPHDKVTYMNLVHLEKENKLYNYYRGINFNPTFVTSDDHGKTWSDPVHFFRNEVGGRHRPYARYVGNGTDTVHVSITDAHPRAFGNNLYYFAFRDGKFYRADGTLIKDLKSGGPLLPSESELVYQGSEKKGKGPGRSAPQSAWTSCIMVDDQGHPHIGYTLYLSNTDHRYRIASWDGKQWIDREVAFAGKCLYEKESSYTGLITLDPADPSVVLISTDVDPTTGKDSGGLHEIYRANVGLQDDTESIKWEAVTRNSKVRNIRPVIVRAGDRRVLMWNRGQFHTYQNYDLDTVGFVESLQGNLGNASATRTEAGTRPSEASTWCRFVPERKDDFAWENDLIAFRAYGPALRQGAENNGIDCWLKRVNYPIIDKWYAQAAEGKSYHQDHGEGLDNYHVGSSAGTGGTGIWLNDKREPLEAFTKYKIIENTPARSSFMLSYEREIDGVLYGEDKTITIEPGKRMFDVRSVFYKNGMPASGLPVCVGVTTHDGKARSFSNKKHGWIACWENLGGSGLGTAAMMDPQQVREIRTVKSQGKDEGHILLIANTGNQGELEYRTGYGWEKAGAIKSQSEWESWLDSQ